MSLAQWRQFAFFDRINPEADTANVLQVLSLPTCSCRLHHLFLLTNRNSPLQNINATAFTSGRGRLVVADILCITRPMTQPSI